MTYTTYIIEKSKELQDKDKFHGLSKDHEYEKIASKDVIGVDMGVVPMTNQEALHVADLPQVIRVTEDMPVRTPTPPLVKSTIPSIEAINAIQMHHIPELWNMGIHGENSNVWVLDTGVDEVHANGLLKGVLKDVYSVFNTDGWDKDGHGTWCIGAVGSPDPNIGVTSKANMYSGQVLDDNGEGNWSGIIKMIERAVAAKAHVISMSLGGPGKSDDPVSRAVDGAFERGVFVAVAAGNDGCEGNPSDGSTPANSAWGMAVAAHDYLGRIAGFSSCGLCVDIAASGYKVKGLGLRGARDSVMSGTSMATPHVAGVAALLCGIGWSAKEVYQYMKAGAVNLGVDPKQQGSGMLDASKTYRSRVPHIGLYPGIPRMTYSDLDGKPKKELPPELILTYRNADHSYLQRIQRG